MLRCSLKARNLCKISRFLHASLGHDAFIALAKRAIALKPTGVHSKSVSLGGRRLLSSRCPVQTSSGEGNDIAIKRLNAAVAKEHSWTPDFELQSPHDIKSLYFSSKAGGQLQRLSPETLSELISLFGSLSHLSTLPPQSTLTEYDAHAFHPLAQQLHNKYRSGVREHWAFVVAVYKNKRTLGYVLDASDHFWLLRASLQDLRKAAKQDKPDGELVARSRARARNYYFLINASPQDWIIHRIYLEGLLEVGVELAADEVVGRLSRILSRYGGLHRQLLPVLWRVLAVSANVISANTKSHFLKILRERVNKLHNDLPDVDLNHVGHGIGSLAEANREDRVAYDAPALRSYLVDILFPPLHDVRSGSSHLRSVYSWGVFEARAALGAFNDGTYANAVEADEASWNNLVLLSLSSPQARVSKGLNLVGLNAGRNMEGVDSQGQVLGWTVICALSALVTEVRRSYNAKATALPTEDIKAIARTLWMLWRKEESWRAGAVMRSRELVSSAAASFMALAAFAKDEHLADAVMRHTRAVVIYPTKLERVPVDEHMLEALAVQYALLRAGNSHPAKIWEHLSYVLRNAELIPMRDDERSKHFVNLVARGLLRNLVHVDPVRTYQVYESASGAGVEIDKVTVLILTKSLILCGHLRIAAKGLNEEIHLLPRQSLQELLDLLVEQTLRTQGPVLDKDLAKALCSFISTSTIVPSSMDNLNRLLSALTRSGYLTEAMKIVKLLEASGSTELLRSNFLAQFVSSLVSHRHYSHLGKLLKRLWVRSSSQLSPLLRQSRFQYIQRLLVHDKNVDERQIATVLPFAIYAWPRIKAHIPFHPRLAHVDKNILALKLSSSLANRHKLDTETLERVVYMLLNVGRIAAALKIVNQHSPKIGTKLGNIILSASLFPRHSRHQHRVIRHASLRLSQLVKTSGFIPDRVTVNIVMKALLRWRGLSSVTTLRSLFDQMILSGYPGLKEYSSSLPVPTGNESTGQRNVLFGGRTIAARNPLPINISAFSDRISFSRHVRPLYKMFVKAFQEKRDIDGARSVRGLLKTEKGEIMRRVRVRHIGRRTARYRKKARD